MDTDNSVKSIERLYNDFLNRHFDIINYEELRKYEDYDYKNNMIGKSNISASEDTKKNESFDIEYGKFSNPGKSQMNMEYHRDRGDETLNIFDVLGECNEFYDNIESFFYDEDKLSYRLDISSENMLKNLKSKLLEKALDEETQKKIVQIAIEAGTIGCLADNKDKHIDGNEGDDGDKYIVFLKPLDDNFKVKKYEKFHLKTDERLEVSVSLNGFIFKVSSEILMELAKKKYNEKICLQNSSIIDFIAGEHKAETNIEGNNYKNITSIWRRVESSIDVDIKNKSFEFFKSMLSGIVKERINANKQTIIEGLEKNSSYTVYLKEDKDICYNFKIDKGTKEIAVYLKGYEEQGEICKVQIIRSS